MQHKETSSYIPLVVAGLLGASAGSVIMSRTSAREEPRPAAAIRGPRVSDTTEGPPEAIWLGRVRPALELVADHLGIPRRPRESERQKALLAAYWRAVAESGDPRSASAARKAAAELGKEDPEVRSTITPAIGPVSAAPLEKDTLLWRERADFVERNLEERRAAELRDEVFERLWPEPKEGTPPPPPGPTLEVVIATLPDYVDSYSAWTFDQLIDVLQRAAGATGLVIDRFYLPDWQPEAAEAPRSGAARSTVPRHEIEPAAVLFRHTSGNLVLLLLPLETATSGIHKAAFVGALGLAQAVANKSPSGGGVTVLGPTFSGSTPSLALALEYAFKEGILSCEGPRPIVRFISGSATDQANRQGLQGVSACGGAAVSFQATVVNDGQALRALRSFFGSANKAWESGQQMAILTESNSGWGQALPTGFDTPEDIGPEACQRVISDAELAASADPFPCAKRLTFPLHISRLRTQAARAPGGGTALPGETVASFRNEDKILPTDQLPALRPELSAAMVETALATTFGALDRLDITAIGLIGSDARDLLFLAEQIRRRKPNVLLFTLEGSLAFLHPDYRPFARGMILASSYPLHSMTQQLLPAPSGDVPIQQFPSMGGQGLYNAFLAAMGNPHRMLDYGTSCGAIASFATCRPSIWVSQVGNNAIWPLRRSETVDDGYTWRPERAGEEVVSPPDPSSAVRAKATWPIAAGVGLVATAILGLVHTLFLWRAYAPTPTAAARVGFGFFETPREAWKRWGLPADDDRLSRLREEHGMDLLACWGALLVPVFLGTHLASVGMNTGQDGPSPGWLGAAAGLRWILLVAFGAAAFGLLARSTWSYRLRGLWRLVRLAGVVLGLLALFALSQSLREPEVWRVPLAGSTAQRYLMLKSLLSPVTPLLLLSVAVYGWGLWNLWRLHHQIAPHGRDCAVVSLLQGESRETADRFEAVLDEPSLEVRGSEALAILVIVAIQLTAAWNHFVTTDGVLMSDALLAGTLLATLLAAHVLAYCHGTGRTLLGALAALNRHPIGSSFARVGREPFLWRLSDGAPTLDQAAPLFRLAEVNARSFSQLLGRLQARARQHQEAGRIYVGDEHRAHRLASGATKYEVAVEGERAAQIEELQIRGVDIERLEETRKRLEHAAPEGDRRPLQASSLWREVASWSQPLVLAMRKVWRRDPYGLTALAMGDQGSEGGPRHLREAETLLALQASYSIRQVVIRLTRGLAFGVSALVLVLFAHLSYLFQGRAFWLGLDWALLGAASLLGLSLFVRMEKDAVLSRLWGTPPGHLSLNGQFVQRIVMYVAIPVVTLFVAFFPEVGQALFSWLEPLQKSLP